MSREAALLLLSLTLAPLWVFGTSQLLLEVGSSDLPGVPCGGFDPRAQLIAS